MNPFLPVLALTIAQTRDVRIILPAREGGHGALLAWATALGALAIALLAAVLFIRWRARRYDPAEAAFRKLARAARLRRAERAELRALARRAGPVPPVALLVSPDALGRAIAQDGHAPAGLAPLGA